MPVQAPFRAGIDQPIRHQGLQHLPPAGAFAGGRQARRPKFVHAQLLPKYTCQPARTPLPRALQLHLVQPHADHRGVICRQRTFGKQRDLTFGAFVEDLDRLAPGELLTIVDLAQVQDLTLHYLAIQ